jgi:predicted ATP-dependent serine protease
VHGLRTGVGILVNQVVKDDSAAGPTTAAHAVDAQLFLDKSETPGLRVLSSDKNRHGPETRTATLVMTARGLVFSENV